LSGTLSLTISNVSFLTPSYSSFHSNPVSSHPTNRLQKWHRKKQNSIWILMVDTQIKICVTAWI
jgi:hypothetical protein